MYASAVKIPSRSSSNGNLQNLSIFAIERRTLIVQLRLLDDNVFLYMRFGRKREHSFILFPFESVYKMRKIHHASLDASDLRAKMKALLLTFLALCGYCVGIPARENGMIICCILL